MNKIAIALLSLAVSSHCLFAQTQNAILQQLSKTEHQETVSGVELNQQGVDNEAFIIQVTDASLSSVGAAQIGNENRVELIQTGNYIDIRISQEGAGNVYEGDIEGHGAKIDITQSGYENMIFQSLMINNAGISIRQQGSSNEVVHTGTSTNSGIQVQQQGAGMKVIIQTN